MSQKLPLRQRNPLLYWGLTALGLAAFGCGVIGIFVPGWPTTVFWIIAVPCFLKTHPAKVRPLLKVPVVGPAMRWWFNLTSPGRHKRRRLRKARQAG